MWRQHSVMFTLRGHIGFIVCWKQITVVDQKDNFTEMSEVEAKKPFLIGVAGGTASGKSTVCKKIMERLGEIDREHKERQVVSISQSSFYRKLTPAEQEKAAKGMFNFDHPHAFDVDLMLRTLKDIQAGRKVLVPVYDYVNNTTSEDKFKTIYPADVVLVEGILIFVLPEICDIFNMKLFVDSDSDSRLARIVMKDIKNRKRDLDQVLNHYMNYVKPGFEEFCLPTKKFADIIIPRGPDNNVAIELIVHHIKDLLRNGEPILPMQPPSPALSPVHGGRRYPSEGGHLSRPH